VDVEVDEGRLGHSDGDYRRDLSDLKRHQDRVGVAVGAEVVAQP
jgi:hypothetical protein